MSDIKSIKEIVKMQLDIEGNDMDTIVSAVRAACEYKKDVALEIQVRNACDQIMLDKLYIKAAREGNVTLMQSLLGKTLWAKLRDDDEERSLMKKIAEFGAAWVEGAKQNEPTPEPDKP